MSDRIMDLFEAIAKRHSYRGPFRDQAIPRADLRRIVQAGLQAPSGKNAQTTGFIIVDDPSLVLRIRPMHATHKAVQTAQAFIACLIDRNPEAVYEGHAFQVEDCAAAVQNILLATTALGYATCWVDGWLRLEHRAEMIGELLGVPPYKVIRVVLPVGIPMEQCLQRERRPFEERAWFNRYARRGS